jgi:hypothetical protein
MTRRIEAIDGSGRAFEFLKDFEDCADAVVHLVEAPAPLPRWRGAGKRSNLFPRRYREYRRREREE